MTFWIASASASSVSRTLAAIAETCRVGSSAKALVASVAMALALAVAAGAPALAQKHAKRAAKPAKQQAQQAQPPQGEASQKKKEVQLIYSPWTKFCLKGKEANAQKVCFTGKDARIESGQPVVAAVIIEPQGMNRKILRVTLPLGMQLRPGTRVIVDQNQPMTAPYVICFNNGCMADYEATADMIKSMKKAQGLVVQAINAAGQPISLVLPLADFAKAYDGPPTDPKIFEAQQRKLQEELQKRADEARKKLEKESQRRGATSSAAPAGKTQ